MQDRNCSRCGITITPENTKRYQNAHMHASECDVCDWHIRDDLAWLTGTGRFAQ